MDPQQQLFFNLFFEALNKYLSNCEIETGAVTIFTNIKDIFNENGKYGKKDPNFGEDGVKTVFKSSKAIKFPGCTLDIFLCGVVCGTYPLNGIWIIVNHPDPVAFHFPLNSGQNVILYMYSTHKNGAIQTFLEPIFGIGNIKKRLYNEPLSLDAFLDAIKIIDSKIKSKYCSHSKTSGRIGEMLL